MRDGEITADPPSEGDPPAGNIRKALATDHAARRSIARADVIIGIDRRDPELGALFFGRVVLERIARSGKEQDMNILEVWVDFETDDVGALVGACVAIKGQVPQPPERSTAITC
jgi:hypothetical protein